jgi:hypothetical protein
MGGLPAGYRSQSWLQIPPENATVKSVEELREAPQRPFYLVIVRWGSDANGLSYVPSVGLSLAW